MKNTPPSESFATPASAEPATSPRFQIYRQARTGNYMAEFKMDSVIEVVEAFLNHSPLFGAVELRILNHQEQRVSPSVERSAKETDFSSPVFNRTNVFHDRLFGLMARQVAEREAMRQAVRQRFRLTA